MRKANYAFPVSRFTGIFIIYSRLEANQGLGCLNGLSVNTLEVETWRNDSQVIGKTRPND